MAERRGPCGDSFCAASCDLEVCQRATPVNRGPQTAPRRIVNAKITVYPRQPGDFPGIGFVSGQTRTTEEWIAFMEQIAKDIRRHVGGVDGVQIDYEWGAHDG